MKIRYVHEPNEEDGAAGDFRPVVFCDVCDRKVRDAREATVLWDSDEMFEARQGTEPLIVHMRCGRVLDRRGGRTHYDFSCHVEDFIQYLRRNMEPRFPEVTHVTYEEREGEEPERVRTAEEKLGFAYG